MTASNQACFVDTNVWIYAFMPAQDPRKAVEAKRLIQEHSASIVVSAQVINEVCSVLLKRKALLEPDIRHLIQAFYEQYPVVALDDTLFLLASELREQLSVSYWDSLILAAALQAQVPILYSEDLQHSQRVRNQLLILNPFLPET